MTMGISDNLIFIVGVSFIGLLVIIILREVAEKQDEEKIIRRDNETEEQKAIGERLSAILTKNYEYGIDLNNMINQVLGKESNLIILEIYTYLNCLCNYFYTKNKVDQSIKKTMIAYSWGVLPRLKSLSGLRLNSDEINKFADDRAKNYSKILNSCKGINADYFDKITSYQTQLIFGIYKYNMLSYYNPFAGNASEQALANVSETQKINGVLSAFVADKIVPRLEILDNMPNYWR
jgi:hypothetical protein